jgi:YwiC-like protein
VLAPKINGLALGRPALAALWLTAAAICAFLAHEPLLVMVDQRGRRAARERAAEATRWFAIFSVPAIALGAVAAAMLRSTARLALIGAEALPVFIVGQPEHTAGGAVRISDRVRVECDARRPLAPRSSAMIFHKGWHAEGRPLRRLRASKCIAVV